MRGTPLPLTLGVFGALLGGCRSEPPPGQQYFDREILPILEASCANATSGCHKADPADPFDMAPGNLDVTSFENVKKRPDLLHTYGAYPVPHLLIKAAGFTSGLQVLYRDQVVNLEIDHAGGAIFAAGSPAYNTLLTWTANGATRDGVRPPNDTTKAEGGCTEKVPADFMEADVTSTPEWAMYNEEFRGVQAALTEANCGAANCHGAPAADFFVTCGSDDRQRAFNFRQVRAFVDAPPDDSELLKRALDPTAGGTFHSGGWYWESLTDPRYVTVRTWAEHVGPLAFGTGNAGKTFFAERVMPLLIARGCAAEGCHSPATMNTFKLRPGTQGFFSALSLQRNYDLVKGKFMPLEVPDVRRSRAVAKNIVKSFGGISHRGGPILGAGDLSTCPAAYDPMTATPLCTLAEWHRIERAALGDPNSGTIPIVYVERDPAHLATLLEFATYQPGSDLLVRDATVDGLGAITGVGAPRSLLGGCAGASNRAAVDVRSPDVRNDGQTVAFAMRTGAAGTLQVFVVDLDGSGCRQVTMSAAHDFDPAWAPDEDWIVYASTQAGGTSKRLNLPQSDLWRIHPDGTGNERMTFLSNSEIGPSFLRQGRMIMTTEKADPRDPAGGFYQVSGRRLNWDLTDYHPLIGQRAQSPEVPGDPSTLRPSVGFQQVTEIRESLDGDLLAIWSNAGARGGAGALGIFNRSVGPFEAGRSDPGFMKSLTFPDPMATGGGATQGAYRSPFPLPDGRVLVSYAGGSFDLGSATSLDFDLVAIDPLTGARTPLVATAGRAEVEAVLALRAPAHKLYYQRQAIGEGGGVDADTAHAAIHFLDLPMLATLLGANLRRGRFIDRLRGADTVTVFDASGQAVGTAPLEADGSVRVRLPASQPLYFAISKDGAELFRMTEEFQYGPGEFITLGVPESFFDHACAGCHGSVSGSELDISVSADTLTGASKSMSSAKPVVPIGP